MLRGEVRRRHYPPRGELASGPCRTSQAFLCTWAMGASAARIGPASGDHGRLCWHMSLLTDMRGLVLPE